MLQLQFQPFPTLFSPRLRLREVTVSDAPEIFFLRSDEQVLRYLDKMPAGSIEEAIEFIGRIKNDLDNAAGILWGITLAEDDTLIGTIGYWRMQPEHHRAEIGYALYPDHQQKGIMDEAMKAVIRYGFDTMRLHSIEANINPLNLASEKLLLKNNFVKEAHFRENYFFNGRFLDSVIYSLVAAGA